MGYYIETGHNLNKTNWLRINHGAQLMLCPPPTFADVPDGAALICVVDNGPFEAAAYIYNQRELEAFDDPRDIRRKWWLLMDKNKAEELSGYKEASR